MGVLECCHPTIALRSVNYALSSAVECSRCGTEFVPVDALRGTVDAYKRALRDIASRPTVERNPNGDDQAAWTMQLIAREALDVSDVRDELRGTAFEVEEVESATPRGAVDNEMVERGAQHLIRSYSWADPSDNDLAWRVARGVLRAAHDTPRGAVGARGLTDLERDSLVGLVAMIANDGLDTYGITGKEAAAVHRALEKLATPRGAVGPLEEVQRAKLRDLIACMGSTSHDDERALAAADALALLVEPATPRGAVDPSGRGEPVRHFWASTDPAPDRFVLWRGNGGVDWEVEYVRADHPRGAVSSADATRDVIRMGAALEAAEQERDRYREALEGIACSFDRWTPPLTHPNGDMSDPAYAGAAAWAAVAEALTALRRIAAGPNDQPSAEPWSKAEALIALDRIEKAAQQQRGPS